MGELQTLLAALPDRDFRIQFDERAAYDPARLNVVNEICARAGGTASVRFYGHFSSIFDCADASRLTECRALFLDTHTPLGNVRAIATMPNLEVFGIDVFNGSKP
jgi:hypothetical protein